MAGSILIGLDDSEVADRALDRAIAEAKASGDELVVLAVVDMPLDPEGPQAFGDLTGGIGMLPLVEPPQLEPLFAKARGRIEAEGLSAEYVWAAGNPSEKITSAARDREARVVFLGAHRRGFFGRLVGTDVAAQVERELDDVPTDVVVVD